MLTEWQERALELLLRVRITSAKKFAIQIWPGTRWSGKDKSRPEFTGIVCLNRLIHDGLVVKYRHGDNGSPAVFEYRVTEYGTLRLLNTLIWEYE